MDSIPNEILLSICSLLRANKEDVKSFRLLGRAHAGVGLEFLISNVTVVPRKSSISRLIAISKHPVLCRRVKMLDIYVDILPSFASVKEWRKQAKYIDERDHEAKSAGNAGATGEESAGHSKLSPKVGKIPPDMVKPGWKHYSALVKEQQDILDYKMLIGALTVSLDRLQSLEGVYVDRLPYYMCSAAAMLFKSDPSNRWYISNTQCHSRSFMELGVELFPTLLKSLDREGRRLCDLHINCFDWRTFNLSPAQLPSPTYLPLQLCSLRLVYPTSTGITDRQDYDSCQEETAIIGSFDNLHFFLTECRSLACLSLDFVPVVDQWLVTTEMLFKDFEWDCLCMIELSGVSVVGEHFLDFLKRHAESLDRLAFGKIWLHSSEDDDHWIEFLETMHDTVKIPSVVFLDVLFSDYAPIIEVDTPLFLCPAIRVGRAIRYLVCQQKSDEFDEEDDVSKVNFDWDRITFDDIRDGYVMD